MLSSGNQNRLKNYGTVPPCKEYIYDEISTLLAFDNDDVGQLIEQLEFETELVTHVDTNYSGELDTWLGTLVTLRNNELYKTIHPIKDGKPNKVICEEAQKAQADLIIMGVSDTNVISNFIFRSTASFVIEHVEIPVLVVPIKSK